MADVFLSYRNTDDRRKLVGRLATILRAHGISVWWDYGLDAGESYRDQIVKALSDAKVVVPLWCEESVVSKWVTMEAELGKEKLLPVRLQRVSPPDQFEAIHAAQLESWDGSILDPKLDSFVRDLCRRLGIVDALPPDTRAELAQLPKLRPLPPPRPKPKAAPAPSSQRRAFPILPAAIGAAALALVAIGAVWISGLGKGQDPAPAEAAGSAKKTYVGANGLTNDQLVSLQWHLQGHDKGGIGSLDYTRRTGATGKGVVLAVIGTGVFPGHPDLAGSRSFLPGADFVSDPKMGNDGDGRDTNASDPGDKCDPSDPTATDSVHGGHTASIVIARTGNGEGVAGIAPDVGFVAIRALGRCGGKLSDIVDGIRWAAGLAPLITANAQEVDNNNKADIITLALGLFEPCPAKMQEAINDAVAAGAIVVAAAGNARTDVKYFTPGGCENVISVAASDARGHMAPYSNFGASVDLLAPGGDMTRDDDNDGRPDGILAAKATSDCVDPAKRGPTIAQCNYAYENGTSMAAMVAAGALALMKSAHPDEPNPDLIKRFLAATRASGIEQCSGECADYPGTETVAGMPGVCYRPCGAGLLDLSLAE